MDSIFSRFTCNKSTESAEAVANTEDISVESGVYQFELDSKAENLFSDGYIHGYAAPTYYGMLSASVLLKLNS